MIIPELLLFTANIETKLVVTLTHQDAEWAPTLYAGRKIFPDWGSKERPLQQVLNRDTTS